MDEPRNVPWEHRVLRLPMPVSDDMEAAIQRRLDEVGELGWELVSVTSAYQPQHAPMLHAYFKRRIV